MPPLSPCHYGNSENENISTEPNQKTIEPGTKSVSHNVDSMLSNDVSQISQLPVTSTVNINQNIVPDVRKENWKQMQPVDNKLSQDSDTPDADSVTPDNIGINTYLMADSPTSSMADSPTSSVADSPKSSMADSPTSSMADSPSSLYRSTSPLSTSINQSQTVSPTPSSTSDCSSITSPETNNTQTKRKMVRTNYTPDQVRTLEEMFHENPYPDSETIEMVGHKMGVAENKIKIWFQNKRARWRRRVNTTVNNVTQPCIHMQPMLPQAYPYGYAPVGQMMTSQLQRMPGYMNNQGFQGSLSSNANYFSFNRISPNPYTVTFSGHNENGNGLSDSKTTKSTSPYELTTSFPYMATKSHNRNISHPHTMSSFTELDTKQSQYQSYMNQQSYGMNVYR